jgi:3-carboxy-cis,cis-muconate cycloisomerase
VSEKLHFLKSSDGAGIYDQLFRSGECELFYSDSVCLQMMLRFEAVLAGGEAAEGVIPEKAAGAIIAKCRADLFDMAELRKQTALAGNLAIPVVKQLTALVAADNKDAAGFVHWGATSQDVIDSGAVAQLSMALDFYERELVRLGNTLAVLAALHRSTIMAARTWMQQALPTSFGLIVAGWLDALLRDRKRLQELRPRVLSLQFGGAVGSLAALGDKGPAIAKALARELNLTLPAVPWHSHRDRMAEAAAFFGISVGTLGKIARDISLHAQTEVGELAEPAAAGRGASSTMPQKNNPVTCAVVLAAAQRVPGLLSTMLSAMPQEYQRGLGGWQAEWEVLPEIVRLSCGALQHLAEMMPGLQVNVERMKANLEVSNGLVFAEAVNMELARRIGKSAAHELVQAECKRAAAEKRHLKDVLGVDVKSQPELKGMDVESLFDAKKYLGSADEFIGRVLQEHAEFPGAAEDPVQTEDK